MAVEWRADRSQVEEAFANDVMALLEADPGDWVVTCGARDRATEAAGYAAWLADPEHAPKFTDPDNSAHCTQPKALAVDVTLRTGETDDWNYQDEAWQRMTRAVLASEHLHSLGPSIGDWDHIERYNWREFVGTP